ncbi:MAG: transcriptional activator RfaH [Bradyrhizobium sp.]|nr:transcriptional activator RfaH [Bradyrhizobium sp.]
MDASALDRDSNAAQHRMIADPGPRWYVAQTHPRSEAKAAEHLRRQGFGVYLPHFRKKRRHARRVDTVKAPLFPRYLFVSVDLETQRWLAIQSTIGVARLICNGDVPALVQRGIVDALRQREDEQGFIKLEQRVFRLGEELRVLDGAFTGTLGLFEGMTDNERVTILLDLLGRKVRVNLDAESVVAA